MIRKVIETPDAPFAWVDVVEPTTEELSELAATYGLHRTSVEDALQPEHMPKLERLDDITFIILRAYDERCAADSNTPRQLTRKLAIFLGAKFLITVHRQDQPYITRLRADWTQRAKHPDQLAHVVNDLMRGVIDSYEAPIGRLQEALSELEERTFNASAGDEVFQNGYQIRRQAAVIRHMIGITDDIVEDLHHVPEAAVPYFRDLKDKCSRLHFYTSELIESVAQMLNLHLSLQAQQSNVVSQRANEVMRLLTVFSAFFLPLNFIAGVYGMNFHNMPELENPYGYYGVLGAMATVALLIFLWFKRRGWLRSQ